MNHILVGTMNVLRNHLLSPYRAQSPCRRIPSLHFSSTHRFIPPNTSAASTQTRWNSNSTKPSVQNDKPKLEDEKPKSEDTSKSEDKPKQETMREFWARQPGPLMTYFIILGSFMAYGLAKEKARREPMRWPYWTWRALTWQYLLGNSWWRQEYELEKLHVGILGSLHNS